MQHKKSHYKEDSTRSTSTTISTKAIEHIVDKLRYENNRKSTKKTYYNVWKKFNQFYIRLDKKPKSWEDRLILFVGYLISDNKQSSTIRSYISAIRSVLTEDGVILNENKYLLTSLTKACRLKNDKVKTRFPVQKGVLKLLLNTTKTYFKNKGQPYLAKLYRAIFCSAYFGLLRVGELSKKMEQDKQPRHSAYRSGASGTTSDCICAYSILQEYITVRNRKSSKDKTEQFFVFSDKSPVQPNQMRNVMRKLLSKSGLQAELYNIHSFRIGCCCDLLKMGFKIPTIQKIGCWRSNAVYSYLR